ncbi:MAG: hypothetical protein QOI14_297 [Actinomycetota bacterium]|jgi:uncharacterized membrane protein YvbJ|nr:hypothetical protein [Actinomycetota bacterium]
MASCVGCGAQLAPAWKFCIHCGIAVDANIPPVNPRTGSVSHVRHRTSRSRTFIVAGVVAFLIVIGLITAAIAFASGSFG